MNAEGPRYHIDHALTPDIHPGMAAYGTDTVGIVDDAQGGVILYCHRDSVEHIILALLTRDRLESVLANPNKET